MSASKPSRFRTRAELNRAIEERELAHFRKLREVRDRLSFDERVPVVVRMDQELAEANASDLDELAALDRLEGEPEGNA